MAAHGDVGRVAQASPSSTRRAYWQQNLVNLGRLQRARDTEKARGELVDSRAVQTRADGPMLRASARTLETYFIGLGTKPVSVSMSRKDV